MKRRTFLASLIAAPIAIKAADSLASPHTGQWQSSTEQAPSAAWVEGRVVAKGPIHEDYDSARDPVYRYYTSHAIQFPEGGRIVAIRKNGKAIYCADPHLDPGPWLEATTSFCSTMALHDNNRLVMEWDDVTDTCGAVGVYEAIIVKQ